MRGEEDMVFFHAEDEMIRLANILWRDYKYYCPHCDFWYKPSEVKEQTDGISDTVCPVCNRTFQQEGIA